MKRATVAILGATGHIAKGLIVNFLRDNHYQLHLFSRSPEKIAAFLKSIGQPKTRGVVIHQYGDFAKHLYDVVVNAVGVGTIDKLKGDYSQYFTVTEAYDNLVIDYLRQKRSGALYLSFSSGAIYGRNFDQPAGKKTINKLPVNQITFQDYYAIARLNAEAKHRAFKSLRIIDLRLFAYFSRFIDLTDHYFITEILNSVLQKKVFITNKSDMIRDYLGPDDLFAMVKKCLVAGKINDAFDVRTAKPVSKMEIINYFASKYGLKYQFDSSWQPASGTGLKNVYYSRYNKAASLGYCPRFTSLQNIKREAKYILKK